VKGTWHLPKPKKKPKGNVLAVSLGFPQKRGGGRQGGRGRQEKVRIGGASTTEISVVWKIPSVDKKLPGIKQKNKNYFLFQSKRRSGLGEKGGLCGGFSQRRGGGQRKSGGPV